MGDCTEAAVSRFSLSDDPIFLFGLGRNSPTADVTMSFTKEAAAGLTIGRMMKNL